METRRVPIEQIKHAPYNPRKIKSSELEKLKKSIETYKCYEPLIVNSRTWHVVGGNQRLRALNELGYKEVDVFMDSELIVKQIKGEYRVKQPHLIPLWTNCKNLLTGFSKFTISHVRRHLNKEADRLVNQAIDAQK